MRSVIFIVIFTVTIFTSYGHQQETEVIAESEKSNESIGLDSKLNTLKEFETNIPQTRFFGSIIRNAVCGLPSGANLACLKYCYIIGYTEGICDNNICQCV